MKIKIEEKGEKAVWSWFVYMKERTIFHKIRIESHICVDVVIIYHYITEFYFENSSRDGFVKEQTERKRLLKTYE